MFLLNLFLNTFNKRKQESGYFLHCVIGSQVFLECKLMVFFIFQIVTKSINFLKQESDVFLHISRVEFVTTWLFPLFSLFTNFSMKNRIEAGDIHSRACIPKAFIMYQNVYMNLWIWFKRIECVCNTGIYENCRKTAVDIHLHNLRYIFISSGDYIQE